MSNPQVSPSTASAPPPWWAWAGPCPTWRRTPGSGPPPASASASSPSSSTPLTPWFTSPWTTPRGSGPQHFIRKNVINNLTASAKLNINLSVECFEPGACRKYIGGVVSSQSDWALSGLFPALNRLMINAAIKTQFSNQIERINHRVNNYPTQEIIHTSTLRLINKYPQMLDVFSSSLSNLRVEGRTNFIF